MPFSTSLYVVEHTQLQVKAQADSMTGKELYKWQVWQCTLWIPYHGEPHWGILTPAYPEHGSLPLTAGLQLVFCVLQTEHTWVSLKIQKRVLSIFFLPCLETRGISCFPMFLSLPITKFLHEKIKWVQRLHHKEMIIWMIHRSVRRY